MDNDFKVYVVSFSKENDRLTYMYYLINTTDSSRNLKIQKNLLTNSRPNSI